MPTLHTCFFCGRTGLKNRQAIRGHVRWCPGRAEAATPGDLAEDVADPAGGADGLPSGILMDPGWTDPVQTRSSPAEADGQGTAPEVEVDLGDLNLVFEHACGRWSIVEPDGELVADCCGDDDGDWDLVGWTDAGPGLLPEGASINVYEGDGEPDLDG